MITYALSADPNYTFEVAPEGVPYLFHIRRIRGLMYVTITDRDSNRISGPLRVCNGEWLIPYAAHNIPGGGNFMIVDTTGQYPDFKNFETTCSLLYYPLSEITTR